MPIQWTPSLAVGVAEIDGQHQEIFGRAERLLVALRSGDRGEVAPLVDSLADYVRTHFAAEERLMAASGYPEADAHREAHERFRADFAEVTRAFAGKGPTALVALTLHNWLSGWLRRHVSGADLDLGRFLRRR